MPAGVNEDTPVKISTEARWLATAFFWNGKQSRWSPYTLLGHVSYIWCKGIMVDASISASLSLGECECKSNYNFLVSWLKFYFSYCMEILISRSHDVHEPIILDIFRTPAFSRQTIHGGMRQQQREEIPEHTWTWRRSGASGHRASVSRNMSGVCMLADSHEKISTNSVYIPH